MASVGQGFLVSQAMMPSGHCAGGLPPVPVPPTPAAPDAPAAPPVPLHSAGRVSFPMQYSQVSHGLLQDVCWVHAGQLVVSPRVPTVQVGTSSTVRVMVPSVRMQQPKQSHPLGTYLKQLSMHFCVAGPGQLFWSAT
jgi:hypothetical protein